MEGGPMTQSVIHKHIIGDWALTTLTLTKRAKILSFAEQYDKLVIWESHDTDEEETEERVFELVLTGTFFHARRKAYINTVLRADGYVVHLFEVI
jgi:hypothetical protein